MTDSVREALNNLYAIAAVPFLIVDQDVKEESAFPKDISHCYKKSFMNTLIDLLGASAHSSGIFLLQLHDYCYCGITRLDDTRYFITAPVSCSSLARNTMPPQMIRFLDPDRVDEFKTLAPHIPVFSFGRLEKLIELGRCIYGVPPAEGTSIQHSIEADPLDKITPSPQQDSWHHHSPNFEDRMSNAIMRGDLNGFLHEHSRPMVGYVGIMSLNPLHQAKYCFVCALFTIVRAAIKGGLSAEYGLQLSDMYCQRMDVMTSAQEIDQLLLSAGIDFCKKVQQYNAQREYSVYTKAVLEYIRCHLFEPVRTEVLSSVVGINTKSMAAYFKKDIGMSIANYITQLRLEEAKTLLTTTNLPIIQISEYLCFSSQSYFGRKYKEYWGITPQKYRESLSV